MRTPRLTAAYAIGPAFGQYRATAPGSQAALVPMACADDEIECPEGSGNCCSANQDCIYRDGRYFCQDRPPTPPPSPVGFGSAIAGA